MIEGRSEVRERAAREGGEEGGKCGAKERGLGKGREVLPDVGEG